MTLKTQIKIFIVEFFGNLGPTCKVPSMLNSILSKDIEEKIEAITSAFGPLMESDQFKDNQIRKLESEVKNLQDNQIKLETENKSLKDILEDVKNKLNLQKSMIEMYETQQNEIMNVLGVPDNERTFQKVLSDIHDLKNTLRNDAGNHYDF